MRSDKAKRRRKLQRYFSNAFQAITGSVYEVSPTLTALDAGRITDSFAENLDLYAESEDSETFERWAIAWVQRLARLTVHLKEMIPILAETAANVPGTDARESTRCAHCVLNRLDKYAGDPHDLDALREWANTQAVCEAINSQAFQQWYAAHRRAVYRGLWDVLEGCPDLGLGQPGQDGVNEVVESLASDTWRWVSEHVDELLKPGAPLHFRLKARARCTARAWKTDRLRDRKDFADFKRFVQGQRLAYDLNGSLVDVDAGYPKPKPIRLGPGDEPKHEQLAA
jgi:hypothetical protein